MEKKIKTTTLIIAIICAPIIFAQATAQGGNITQVNLTIFNETTIWQGLAGTINFIGPDSLPSITTEGGEVNGTTLNITSACTNPSSVTGFIFYSNSTSIPTSLTAGNLTTLDNFAGGVVDSASNTFTTTSTFTIGGTPITNVPTTFTYVNNGSQTTVFREGYLNDADNNLVFAVEINLNTVGYNSSRFDFQAILPTQNTTPVPFYLTSNVQITCPSGGGGGGSSNGYSACILNWVCTEWEPCINNLQKRTCKSSACARTIAEPPQLKTCDSDELTPGIEEPQLVDFLQKNPPIITAPEQATILATRIHTMPITIYNPNSHSVQNFHIELSSDSTTQTYTPLHIAPKWYDLFGILPKPNTFGEHKISSRNIPITLAPKETITIPLTIIGPPITPRTLFAKIMTYSNDVPLTTQPITIKTETPPFAFMRQTTQSTTTTYFLIDNRAQEKRKANLELDFNFNKNTKFTDETTLDLNSNSINAFSQTYRTLFDFNSIRARSENNIEEAK